MSTPILGQAQTSEDAVIRWVLGKGGPFWYPKELVPLYFRLAPALGVRPEVAVVQGCHETGYGRFGRAVTPWHYNPCGLKIPDPRGLADNDPAAHATFPNWETGVLAHLEHLALYAGCPGFPRPYRKIDAGTWTGCADPRHFPWVFGCAESVEDLGGEQVPDDEADWAPSPEYGYRLVNLLDDLLGNAA